MGISQLVAFFLLVALAIWTLHQNSRLKADLKRRIEVDRDVKFYTSHFLHFHINRIIERFPLQGDRKEVVKATEIRKLVMRRLIEEIMRLRPASIVQWLPIILERVQNLSTDARWWDPDLVMLSRDEVYNLIVYSLEPTQPAPQQSVQEDGSAQ